jgi:hypothetical protein
MLPNNFIDVKYVFFSKVSKQVVTQLDYWVQGEALPSPQFFVDGAKLHPQKIAN